jgi:hypothetical protein
MSEPSFDKPELAGDLVRVHRAVTRAVGVAQEAGAAYAAAGYPDDEMKAGYLTYVRCLALLLHGHHTTEDESMFPLLRDKIPDAPYDALTAQHSAMMPILDEIDGARKSARDEALSPEPGRGLTALVRALARIDALWRTHIALEEAHFGPEAIGAFLTMEERRRLGGVVSRNAATHQRPFSLMLAFFLYNMSPQDRAVMVQMIPGIANLLLKLWRSRWRSMAPFLLLDD